ncbi:hypothetical protein CS390_09245 [Pseudomonas sp. HLS-6]|uniref:hypothetical protein n=1 Tax=Pseudomonas sp. HLS-6 TaxID=2049589 RepID=UPI000C1893AB|nr:hypothetical protein [Pseudomonas sp. HLS-6]ATR82732.1 hypothetical protein CS390_09245 [Pseudomonas sp. HLS-6]
MPTENRSSNTDPRDLFIRDNPLGLGEKELAKDRTGFTDQRTHSDYLTFLAGYEAAQPAEQHQGEPVDALLLDDCVEHKHPGYGAGYFGTEVIQLYTHADPIEVERPSQIALSLQTKLKSVESERDRLRAQLAEQEHSARELLRIIGMSVQGSAAYNRAVIAFHDSLNADTKPN